MTESFCTILQLVPFCGVCPWAHGDPWHLGKASRCFYSLCSMWHSWVPQNREEMGGAKAGICHELCP